MNVGNRLPHGPRRIIAAIVCALLPVLAAHQSGAGAQSVGSSVTPVVPPDPAELALRRLKLDYSTGPSVLHITLPPAAPMSRSDARADRPLQIGFPRPIPSEYRGDLSPHIEWTPLDDGSIVGIILVTSPGAEALRAGIYAGLGPGGEIRIFDGHVVEGSLEESDASLDFPVITEEDFYEGGEPEVLWLPTVESDTIGIEITLPSEDALSEFWLRIEQVSHIYFPMESLGVAPRALECPNHVDIQCRIANIASGKDRAVARINFVDGGYSGLCSGTLLNDAVDGTSIPYFLTANHCVATGTVARTVEAWWFWQRASCGSARIDSRYARTTGGADLLATTVPQDSSLLRLRGRLPGGLQFSGSSFEDVRVGTRVYGIHHPDGEVKKYSGGAVRLRLPQQEICADEARTDCFTLRNGIGVQWTEGATEPGSSGSGLFQGDLLIGVLSGGSGCGALGGPRDGDAYGPFSDFFPRIRRWLVPGTQPGPRASHTLPLVTPASNLSLQGFVRIINNSDVTGEVDIVAIDDNGRQFGPVPLSLKGRGAQHFNSGDLERGNSAKGLPRGVGNGTGNWRLELTTDLEIEALAYIRTSDGFVTNMHEVAAETAEGSKRYHVPFFNPGRNSNQVSKMRLINPGRSSASIEITGVDDEGFGPPLGTVRLTLGAGRARILTAAQLETGRASGLSGRLGAGQGKWRLSVSANQPIQVMSLLELPSGHLTNLSRGREGTVPETPPPPARAPDLVVQSPSVDDSSPDPRQAFLFSATVRNQGTAQAAASRMRVYRSPDATITRSDAQIGWTPVNALAPSAASNNGYTAIAPTSPGTYYYGACVDAVAGESNTANNCSSGVRVTVSAASAVWGAYAAGWLGSSCGAGYGWRSALNQPDRVTASNLAVARCQSAGLRRCDWVVRFQNCGAVAYGSSSVDCALYGGGGATRSLAERAALSNCRAAYSNCRIPADSTTGAKASICNAGTRTAPAAEAPEDAPSRVETNDGQLLTFEN